MESPIKTIQRDKPDQGTAVRRMLMKPRSMGTIMQANGGSGPGFDALRIGLALAILAYHSVLLSPDKAMVEFVNRHFRECILALVPMFFCLSGFLVTGSALRTQSVRVFLTYRGLRIFPALAVEVALSALLLGPWLTSLPLNEYFSSKQFFSYFGNIIGAVRMVLPGVFLDNPHPDVVNGSLWTLQPEFYCYLLMAGLMASTVVYRRNWYGWTFMAAAATLSMLAALSGLGNPGDLLPPNVILYYFFVGIAAYHWKDRIPVHPLLFAGAAMLTWWMLPQQGMSYLAALPLTYCTLWLGMLKLPRLPLLQKGDYSYGIYLFNFPIQQSLVHLFPQLETWWLLLLCAAPLTLLFAAASWHWIEKPALRLKKRFVPTAPATANPLPQTPQLAGSKG